VATTPHVWTVLLSWHWHADVLAVLGTSAVVYVVGWRRLRRHAPAGGGLGSAWRLLTYLAGLACLVLALLSPLDHLARVLFTAHMAQHQLLLMMAPPLLLLANPFPVVLWGLPRRLRRGAGPWLTRRGRVRRAWDWLTWMPVAGLLYTANLWGWHVPAAYEAALRSELVHDLEHLAFFGTAVLFWWPVVNPAPRQARLQRPIQYGYRIAYLILATAQNTLLGAILGLSERLYYPSYAAAPRLLDWTPLDDQAFGGGVMWSGGHMYLIGILVLVGRVMDSERPGHAGVPTDLPRAEP
jgi:putative membrane protein